MNLRQNYKIMLFFGFFALFLFLYYLGLLQPVEKLWSILFDQTSVKVVALGTEANSAINSITASKKQLLTEVARLQNKVNDLSNTILQMQSIKKENQELRDLLDFDQRHTYQLIPGEITHKNISEIMQVIIINQGYRQGVKPGNAVIIGQGTIIGKIEKVEAYRSTVRLTVDEGSHILATLENMDHNITGVISGKQGVALLLDLIPKNISIFPGQKVLTNGLQESIPADLYLGEIIELQDSPNEIFNSALVKPPYQANDLKTAAIIIEQN